MNAIQRRIEAAALKLFAARGNSGVTVSELAAEAGVSRGALYRNIESMPELFDQLRRQLAFDIHDANARMLDARGDIDPPLRIATAVRSLIRLAHDSPDSGRLFVRFALTDESLRETLLGPPMSDIAAGIDSDRFVVTAGRELSIASFLTGTVISGMWMVLGGHQSWWTAGVGAAELILVALGIPRSEALDLAQHSLPDPLRC